MSERGKVAYYTLGCKLNFSETSTLAQSLTDEGFERVEFGSNADVFVINTCSVTDNADKKCRYIVRQAMKANPAAFVIVVGCYAQLKPDEIAQIPGVDLVLGATEKFKVTDYLFDLRKKGLGEVHSCEIQEANHFVGAYSIGDRTRGFLKVQDGCDYKCTYCTIPLARGISRSDKLENVLHNAHILAQKGIKEIVLTGVNIGDYGKGEFGNKKHEHTFLDLVTALDTVEDVYRYRISSIEPNLLSNETIDFVSRSQKFAPHFHIPLQSGSNEILKLMKRRYQRELYAERVATIKSKMPHSCIGVDVIVGFPGETEERFLETYDFLNSLDISYLHVFTYSERDNTEAADMTDVVPMETRNQRNKMLRILSAKKRRAFYESQLGYQGTVLVEAEQKKGRMYGFTENYVKVSLPYNENQVNTLHPIRLESIDHESHARGIILSNETIAVL